MNIHPDHNTSATPRRPDHAAGKWETIVNPDPVLAVRCLMAAVWRQDAVADPHANGGA